MASKANEEQSKKLQLKTFFPFLKPYRLHLIFGPAAKMVEAVLELLTPLLMARVIDNALLHHENRDYFIRNGAFLLLLVVISVVFSFICQFLAATASQGVGTKIRRALFAKVQSLSFSQLDRFGTSSLTNRLGPDVVHIQYAIAMFIRLLFRAPFLAIGGSIMAFTIQPRIALLLVASILIAALILAIIVRKTMHPMRNVQLRTDKLSRLVSDHFSGIRIIRAFNRSEHERKYFSKTNQETSSYMAKAAKISAFMNPATVIVVNLAIVLALYWGSALVHNGSILPGEMIALINYFTQVLLAMTVTANLVLAVPRTVNAMERIQEVLLEKEDLERIEEIKHTVIDSESILAVRNLDYAYDKHATYVLENLSFDIKRGSFVGIIGSTGSGKSSLALLLQRFYDPIAGHIYLDGKDIRSYTREEISQKISFVPQQVDLFSGTIRSNITLDKKREISETGIWNALETAQAKDFVENLPNALDSQVERGGRNFSGGQKQRLSVARALAQNTDLVIFDDSMSALDYKTERDLMKALRDEKDKTYILITQRIHNIIEADWIYVLEEGKIVGEGKHEDLLRSNQVYQEIQASQITPEEASL